MQRCPSRLQPPTRGLQVNSLPYQQSAAAFASAYTGLASKDLRSAQTAAQAKSGRSLAGKWQRIPSKSESLEPTAELFELSFAAMQGVKLANTMVVEDTPEALSTSIKVSYTHNATLH